MDSFGRTPARIEDRARLIIPHYVWTWQDGRKKHGWCTSCGRIIERLDAEKITCPDEFMDEGEFMGQSRVSWYRRNWDGTAHHGKAGLCPNCGQEVEFRSLARGRARMEDKLFFVVYQKSAVDKNAIVCVGYRIFIPWRELDSWYDYHVPMQITPMEICVFRWGKGGQRFIADARWKFFCKTDSGRDIWTKQVTGAWSRRRECVSGYTGQRSCMGYDNTAVVMDVTALNDAVEGTPWAWCLNHLPWTDAAMYFDRITLLDRISRYPCVEYMLKRGWGELTKLVIDHKGRGVINPRGRTAQKVLQVTQDEWGWIKGSKVQVTEDLLRMMKIRRTQGLRMSLEVCRWAADTRSVDALEMLKATHKEVDPVAACKYARRQKSSLRDYNDYLRQLKQLGADLHDRRVLWPADLHLAHQRCTEQLQILDAERRALKLKAEMSKDSETLRRLADTVRKLQKTHTFHACGLVMEPFATVEEIVNEGVQLSICIGSYVKRYAAGGTILCKLRREDAPEKPFHAVEFSASSGAMVQCRGHENKTLDVDEKLIRDFWAEWDKARGTRTNVSITVRATGNREGHAA